MSIEYVVISVSGECNMQCPFCFRVDTSSNMSLEVFQDVISNLKSIGATHLNFTGGEPLLNHELDEILRESHNQGFVNILSTNGLLLSSIKDPILSNISHLCLSLDGDCKESNDIIRGNGHFEKIVQLISEYKECDCNFDLKINTVVFRDNIDNIKGISQLLCSDKLIRHKLFQLSSRGELNASVESQVITNDDFFVIVEELSVNTPINVKLSNMLSTDSVEYIIVDVYGNMIYPDNTTYRRVEISTIPFDNNTYKSTSLKDNEA